MKFIVALCVTVVLGVVNGNPCPPVSDIAPCICTYYENDTAMDLDCSAARSNEELGNVFKAEFPFNHFRIFKIVDNIEITSLEAGVFGIVKFEQIILHGTKITNIDPNTLDNSTSLLQSLSIHSTPISGQVFPFTNALNDFTALKTLDVTECNLGVFPTVTSSYLETLTLARNGFTNLFLGILSGVPALRTFNVQENSISSVDPGLFLSTLFLKEVNLEDNAFVILAASSFSFAGAPNVLKFGNNGITTVDSRAFSGLSSGTILDFRSNQIMKLDQTNWQEIFDTVLQVDFSDNPLECGCDVAWIVFTPSFNSKVSPNTMCSDGTLFSDLDPILFEQLCFLNK